MDGQPTITPSIGPWLSIEQVAERFGIPVSTVWKLRSQRKAPPGVRMGKRLRFHIEDIEQWELQRRQASAR